MNKLIEELAPYRHWVCWYGKTIKTKDGEERTTKILGYIGKDNMFHNAKTNKPETWGTYGQAKSWAARLRTPRKGIGFVLGLEIPFICIDLDHCINKADKTFTDDEAGETARRVLDIIKKNGEETYIEVSPSGEGLHIWGRATLPAEKEKGVRGKYIEMYRAGRYMTITGRPYTDTLSPVGTIQKSVDEIIKEFHLIKDSPAERTEKKAVTPSPVLNLSDDEIITKIRNSKSGPKFHSLYELGDTSTYGDNQSRADQALLSILAFWTKDAEQIKRIFLSSKLAKTLARKKGHEEDYLNRSITKALETVKGGFNPKAYAARKQEEELRPEFEKAMREQEKAVPFDRQVSDFKKNDSENADRLAEMYKGKFLYCVDLKTWLKYDGTKWRTVPPVELQEPARLAIKKELADMAAAYAAFTQGGGELRGDMSKAYISILNYLNGTAQNNMAIQNSIKLAAGKPSMKCYADAFDNDTYLLNCANGVLNLKTFEFMPHSSEQRFMKCTRAAYSPEEHSSLWRDTVRQIVPDNDTYDYLQRMAGYCLTGSAADEKLFFLFGPGGTGKGTFIETLGHALGDYSTSVPVEILLSSKGNKEGNNPTPYKAMLKGVRLALSSESGMGNYFDEATLKYLTGRDAITGRFLHSNPITFTPSHKLVISSNYMPSIRDAADEGVKRRLVIIPFDADIKDRDTTLKDRLFTPENLSDCLLWAVEGCRKWQAEGLQEDTFSQEIRGAISSYYLDNDALGEFIDTKCILKGSIESLTLYNAYKAFLIEAGEDAEISHSRFTRQLKEKLGAAIKSYRTSKTRGFEGISLEHL